MKVYISGPMTGHQNNNAAKFRAEEAMVRAWFGDTAIEIINPAAEPDILVGGMIDYRATIMRDLRLIQKCDVMWMMDGWGRSLGCVIEYMAMREKCNTSPHLRGMGYARHRVVNIIIPDAEPYYFPFTNLARGAGNYMDKDPDTLEADGGPRCVITVQG